MIFPPHHLAARRPSPSQFEDLFDDDDTTTSTEAFPASNSIYVSDSAITTDMPSLTDSSYAKPSSSHYNSDTYNSDPAQPTYPTATYDITVNGNFIDGPNDESQQWDKFSEGVKAAVIIACIFGVVAIVIASIWFCCGKPRRRRLKAEEDMMRYRERMDAEARAGAVPGVQVPLRNLEGGDATIGNVNGAGGRQSIAPVAARGAVGRVASRLSRHVSMRSTGTAGGGGGTDAPPRYEEQVPPAHQRLAGGMVRRGGGGGGHHHHNQISPMQEEEDGMGMVADGKTPLSEIPFEDVVLTPTRSQASGSASPSGSEGGRDFGNRHAMGNGRGDTTGHTNA